MYTRACELLFFFFLFFLIWTKPFVRGLVPLTLTKAGNFRLALGLPFLVFGVSSTEKAETVFA